MVTPLLLLSSESSVSVNEKLDTLGRRKSSSKKYCKSQRKALQMKGFFRRVPSYRSAASLNRHFI